MIRINQTSDIQYFAVTLTELCTLPAPKFLFVFQNEITKETQKVFLTDISPVPTRFNLFEIQGTYFPSAGWHTYKAYEAADTTSEDETLLNLVEAGRLFVNSDNSNAFIQQQTEIKYKEYAG